MTIMDSIFTVPHGTRVLSVVSHEAVFKTREFDDTPSFEVILLSYRCYLINIRYHHLTLFKQGFLFIKASYLHI